MTQPKNGGGKSTTAKPKKKAAAKTVKASQSENSDQNSAADAADNEQPVEKKMEKKEPDTQTNTATTAQKEQVVVAPLPARAMHNDGGSGKGLGVLALIVSLVALAGAGYSWFQTTVNAPLADGEQTLRLDGIEQQINTLNTSVGQKLGDLSGSVEQKLSALDTSQTSAQSGLNAQFSQLMQRVSGAETGVAGQVDEVKKLVSSAEVDVVAQVNALKKSISESEANLSEQIWAVSEESLNFQEKLSAQVTKSTGSLQDQSAKFEKEFEEMSSSVAALQQDLGSDGDMWGMLQVEHLLVLANQRLQLGQDPGSARKALTLADQQLQDIDDPKLLATRQALSGEIASLSQIEQIDFAKVSGTMTLLSKTLSDLPVRGASEVSAPTKQASDDASAAQPEASTSDKIANVGLSFLADLSSLVQVEQGGKSIVPTITPEIKKMALVKGQLMLESAQVALLRSQPALFADRIDATKAWVSENYDNANPQTASWLGQLSGLKALAPVVEFPDISGSLNELRSVIAKEG